MYRLLEGVEEEPVASLLTGKVSSGMTEPLPFTVVSDLAEIVGQEHVITDPDRLLVYAVSYTHLRAHET